MHARPSHARAHLDGAHRGSDFWTRIDGAIADALLRVMPVMPGTAIGLPVPPQLRVF